MPCFRPLPAWYNPGKHPSTGSKISFSRHFSEAKALHLPCGQCIGCRLERSRRWAVRLMHEAQLHESSCFLTLTYSDDFIPKDLSLDVRHFQLFMKRLRRDFDGRLRFFHCGEYGEKFSRPHYHVCLFGTDFRTDRFDVELSATGLPQWDSLRLCEAWGFGRTRIGELTFESAAYVARYCLKKVTGELAEGHYQGRKPEYVTMSRRPGIGAGWFDRFSAEVYPADSVVMRGREMMPPPFYDKLLEKVDPSLFRSIKRERETERGFSLSFASPQIFPVLTDKQLYESSDSRLTVREKVKQLTAEACLERKL